MGRQKCYRQKRHEQVHSLKAKSLFGHLVAELMQTQGFTQREAEIVAKPCFIYFKQNLCHTAEGQIKFEIIDGIDNHKRTKKETKKAILTPIAYSDIELFEEFGLKEMQMGRLLRMIEEAYTQGGLLDIKRVCFLTQITDKPLRERLHELWDLGIKAPLSMIRRKYLDNMTMFRQSYCIKQYLEGEELEKLRRELFISKTDWEQIYSTFRHINNQQDDDIAQLARNFDIAEQLVVEYLDIGSNYSDNYIYKQYQTSSLKIDCPGDVSTREKFINELTSHCGFSPAVADKLERDLRELGKKIDSQNRQPNEIIYYAVSDHEPSGKPLIECELVPVKISYYSNDDLELFNKETSIDLKWEKAKRYATQVRKQGALLNQIDIAFLLGISPVVLQKLTKENDKVILPTRGNIIDMGPTPSHAEKIINLYLQGYTETQISYRSGHSYDSIERYIDSFTKVVGLLVKEGLSPAEIRKILGCSRRLVNKYIELYYKFNTDEYQWWIAKVYKRYENCVKKN